MILRVGDIVKIDTFTPETETYSENRKAVNADHETMETVEVIHCYILRSTNSILTIFDSNSICSGPSS